MNCFSKNNQNEYVFNLDVKEEQSNFNNEAELFKELPNDYLFFGDNKYQSLFWNEQEVNADDINYSNHFDKCASNELIRRDFEFEHSFVSIELKTDNLALKNFNLHNYMIISESGAQDSSNNFEMNDDYSKEWNKPDLDGEDNQTTQIQVDKQVIDSKLIEFNTSQSKKRGPRRKKFNRWGKENDKMLYKALLNLVNKNKISRKFIENIDDIDILSDLREIKIISNIIKWKNPYEDLIKRINKILKSSKLSVREVMALKRIVKTRYPSEPINYDHLMQEFPGKSKETLQRECEKLLRRSKRI